MCLGLDHSCHLLPALSLNKLLWQTQENDISVLLLFPSSGPPLCTSSFQSSWTCCGLGCWKTTKRTGGEFIRCVRLGAPAVSWRSSCLDNPTALPPLATWNFFPNCFIIAEVKGVFQMLYMNFCVLRCYLMNTEQFHFAAIQLLE